MISPTLSVFFERAVLGLLLLPLVHQPALAHGLSASCRPRGDQVEVEAYFTDNTPAAEAKVQVKDSNGEVIAEGVTDSHGRWSFPKPSPGRYLVTVDAGAGHYEELHLTEEFFGEGPSREEFTQFPWLKLAIGVGAILLFSFALCYARRGSR